MSLSLFRQTHSQSYGRMSPHNLHKYAVWLCKAQYACAKGPLWKLAPHHSSLSSPLPFPSRTHDLFFRPLSTNFHVGLLYIMIHSCRLSYNTYGIKNGENWANAQLQASALLTGIQSTERHCACYQRRKVSISITQLCTPVTYNSSLPARQCNHGTNFMGVTSVFD